MENKKIEQERLPKGITRCRDGRYQARYTYRGHRYSIYDRDVSLLAMKLEKAKESISSQKPEPLEITLNQWFKIWSEDYKSMTVKQGTKDSYQCMFHYYISPMLGEYRVCEIKGSDIQRFYNGMAQKGYAKATITLSAAVLGSLFRQAVQNEMIDKNPVEHACLPRCRRREVRTVLTMEQQERLLRQVEGWDINNLIILALATGMRIGELTGLEWKEISFDRAEITVTGTLKQQREGRDFYKDMPKTKASERVIPLLDRAKSALLDERKRQSKMKQEASESWNPVVGLENLVFTRKDGKPISGQYIRQQLTRLVDEMNGHRSAASKRKQFLLPTEDPMPYFTPHCLRHTFATRALECGIPPKVVQELLGHSSITMTLDLYTHVLPQTKADEIKKISGIF